MLIHLHNYIYDVCDVVYITIFMTLKILHTHHGIFYRIFYANWLKYLANQCQEECLLEHVLGLKRDQRSLCNFPISTTRPSYLWLP